MNSKDYFEQQAVRETLTPITDASTSQAAFHLLKEQLTRGAKVCPQHLIGWQGGSRRHDTYWLAEHGIWTVLEPSPPDSKKGPRRRFWNCFGLDDPANRSMLSITVEMNPPHEGIDRRLGGLFLSDESGATYIAHTGKVGGGRRGIGKKSFQEFLKGWNWREVPEFREEVLVFGPILSTDFPNRVADFVRQTAKFKAQAA